MKMHNSDFEATRTLQVSKLPPAGLGNRLFTFSFLVQSAKNMGLKLALHPRDFYDVQKWFIAENIQKAKFFRLPLNTAIHPSSYQELSEASSASLKPQRIQGHFLGEYFQDAKEDPVTNLLRTPNLPPVPKYISVHFRGGDFHRWDKKSILPLDYYLRAAALAKEISGLGSFYVTTDDPTLASFQEFKAVFAKELIPHAELEQIPGSKAERDFWRLSQGQILISGASTYAIWASIYGGVPTIYSRNWIDYRTEEGEMFWSKLSTNNFPSCKFVGAV